MRRIGPSALIALLVLPLLASAQPPRRAHHSLVYDAARARVLLTGGSTPVNGGQSFEFFNDLWEFDGTRWRALAPSGEKTSGSALAFDARRSRVLAFGGYRGTAVGDLRTLTNDTWVALPAPPGLTAAEPGFVHDAARDRFVAFGGSGSNGANGATWEFVGEQWTRLDIASPPARQAHAMVYDAKRGRTVLFGGMGDGAPGARPPLLGDTWEFDGTAWTKLDVAGPAARHGLSRLRREA